MTDPPLRILLADDSQVFQRVTLTILRNQGHDADVVADGVQAVDALAKQPYDVILMDLQMPNKDGLQATADIRQTLPAERQPYIIGITASINAEICDACFAAGMDDYLSKPFQGPQLSEALGRIPRRAPS